MLAEDTREADPLLATRRVKLSSLYASITALEIHLHAVEAQEDERLKIERRLDSLYASSCFTRLQAYPEQGELDRRASLAFEAYETARKDVARENRAHQLLVDGAAQLGECIWRLELTFKNSKLVRVTRIVREDGANHLYAVCQTL